MASRLLVADVRKAFSSRRLLARRTQAVLAGIDLELGPGDAVALVGENGAGKTTLLRIVASLLTPDSGRVELDSKPVARERSRIGFASGDERSFYLRLGGLENLRFFAGLHDLRGCALEQRLAPLVEAMDLGDILAKRVSACSAGMRARLGLARAMLHEPELLLLDEPTKSLDPHHAEQVHAELRRRVSEGTMLLMATHGDDAEKLHGRVLRLAGGRLTEARRTGAK